MTAPWSVSVGMPTTVAWRARHAELRADDRDLRRWPRLILVVAQVDLPAPLLPALAASSAAPNRSARGDLQPSLRRAHALARDSNTCATRFRTWWTSLRTAREAIVAADGGRACDARGAGVAAAAGGAAGAAGRHRRAGLRHRARIEQPAAGHFRLCRSPSARSGTRAIAARADLALVHQESVRASAIIRNLSRFGRQQNLDAGRPSIWARCSRRSSNCASASSPSRTSAWSATNARRVRRTRSSPNSSRWS